MSPRRSDPFAMASVIVAAMTTAAACGSSREAPPANLTDFVNVFCAAARSCCASAPGASALLATCETSLAENSPLYAAVVAGTVVPNQDVLPGCVAALRQTATNCAVPAACQNLWRGTKAAGEPCTLAGECRQDTGAALCFRASDSSDASTTTGACRAAPRGTTGAACLASCGPGLDCSETLFAQAATPIALCYTDDSLYCEAGACTALHALGAACDVDPECGTESYCATTCTARKAAGQPCVHDNECSQKDHLACVADTCAAPSFASDAVCAGDLF